MKLLSITITSVYTVYTEVSPNSHINGMKKEKTSRLNFSFTSAPAWVSHKIPENYKIGTKPSLMRDDVDFYDLKTRSMR